MSSKKIKIGFYRNYDYPDLLRQSEDNKGCWGEYDFIDLDKTPTDKVDYLIVMNCPLKKIQTRVKKGAKIILIQEPPTESNDFYKFFIRHFDLSISHFDEVESLKNLKLQAGLPWHVDKTYQELIETNAILKNKSISWITSARTNHPEHLNRLAFIDYLKNNEFDFDLFGRGFEPIANKYDGIAPYNYSIAAENYVNKDYFTEKIVDIFLSNTMPIYYGCPNIDKYFPKESYIQIDLKKKEEALDIIQEAIDNNLHLKNKEYIQEAKELILKKHQFFPFITDLIQKQINSGEGYEEFKLRTNGLTNLENFKSNIRKLF